MPANNIIPRLLWLAALLAFAAVAVHLSGNNQPLFLILNHWAHDYPAALWSNLTMVADTLFAMAALLAVCATKPDLLPRALLLLLVGTLVVHGSKAFFDAARPAVVLAQDSFYIIGPTLKHHSFPSGHSFTVFASMALIASQCRLPAQLLLLTVAAAAAFSRMAVGAHWPLDVLTGSALGLIVAAIVLAWRPLPAWSEHPATLLLTVTLLTLGTIYLPFFNSRYPHALFLTSTSAVVAILVALKWFWWPLMKLTTKLIQDKRG